MIVTPSDGFAFVVSICIGNLAYRCAGLQVTVVLTLLNAFQALILCWGIAVAMGIWE